MGGSTLTVSLTVRNLFFWTTSIKKVQNKKKSRILAPNIGEDIPEDDVLRKCERQATKKKEDWEYARI